jgi:hypothetical protein
MSGIDESDIELAKHYEELLKNAMGDCAETKPLLLALLSFITQISFASKEPDVCMIVVMDQLTTLYLSNREQLLKGKDA